MSLFGFFSDLKAIRIQGLIKAFGSNLNERNAAMQALAKIGTPAVEPLIAVLNDGKHLVQWAAIKTLGEIKDARAVEPLIAILNDSSAKWMTMNSFDWYLYEWNTHYLTRIALRQLSALPKPIPGQCYMCGKKVGYPSGISFVKDISKLMESSAYACKSCETEFCLSCARKIADNDNPADSCLYCEKSFGWFKR